MKNVLKTAPASYPVSLEEIKQHLNIERGWTEDDDYLQTLRYTATKKAEQFLRRRLITQTWYAYYNEWPKGDYIILPFGQLQNVIDPIIKYTETDGDTTTWSTDGGEWNSDVDQDPGRIVLEYGYPWPSYDLHPQNPIQIEFVCGYGLLGTDVEPMINHAIKLVIEDMYGNRGDVVIGMTTTSNLGVFQDLLTPYRIHGLAT